VSWKPPFAVYVPTTLRRLCSERALALPLALGVMVALSISVTAVADYTFSNTRNSADSSARNYAYAAAETGMNDALSVLFNSGSVTQKLFTDQTTPVSVAAPPAYHTSYTWTASFDSSVSPNVWTITSTGKVANLTQGTKPDTKVLKRKLEITTSAPQGSNWSVWNYVYADAAPGGTCLTVSNTAGFSTPIYTKGDLCLGQNAHLDKNPAWPAGNPPQVQVGGKIALSNNSYVGTSANKLNAVQAPSCTTQANATPHTCSSSDPVWADQYITTPPTLTKPVIDLATWYQNAMPGPKAACTSTTGTPPAFDTNTTQDGLAGTINLTPAQAYDCKYVDSFGQTQGEIKWTPGSPGSLDVSGVMFFDGNLNWTTNAVYHGRATIYFGGTINFSTNNAYLCGTDTSCTTAVSTGTTNWDTTNDLLVLVAGSNAQSPSFAFNMSNGCIFQGAAEANGDANESNGDGLWGSLIAHQVYLNNGAHDWYVPFGTPVPGMPGASNPNPTLVFPPNSFSG